ncbi:MAG: WD40 repeat domain-containing protein [Bryobacteraceae bacterium]
MLVLLFVAALGAAAFAKSQRSVAARERAKSSSLEFAALSAGITNPDLRVLLALHAAALSKTPNAEQAVYEAVQDLKGPRFYTPGQSYLVSSLAFSPDSRLLATANSDGTISLWDTQTGTRMSEPLKIDAESLAFRSDGTLAVGTSKGVVKILDRLGKVLTEITVGIGSVKAISFSSDHTENVWQLFLR